MGLVLTGTVTEPNLVGFDTAFVAALIASAIRQIVFRPRAQFAFSSKLDLLSVVVATLELNTPEKCVVRRRMRRAYWYARDTKWSKH